MLEEGTLSSLNATWEDNVVEILEDRRQIFFVLRKPHSENREI